jgi:hypothetical protein
MGQCVTINVGNENSGAAEGGGGTSVSVGGQQEEEEEEEECLPSCMKAIGCAMCL